MSFWLGAGKSSSRTKGRPSALALCSGGCRIARMNMNKQLSALMLVAMALSITSGEAKAQRQSIDPNALPAANFYKHRLKVQVVNENPEITNTMRNPEPKKVLVIQTPQMQQQQVQYIFAPGSSSPGLPPGAIDLSGPPQSGFTSNMPLNPNGFSKRDSLPQGQSTGGLSGKPMVAGRMLGPRNAQPPASTAPAAALSSAPAQTMAYKPYNNGSGTGTTGGSNTTTVSTVSGKLQRGSLIGKTK